MSGNPEAEKELPKVVPLDLARTQITALRTVEGKPPLVVTGGSLRNMRVLTQCVSNANPTSIGTPTILTTNLVSQAVLKSDPSRPQLANIITSSSSQPQIAGNISRPTQITLSTTPLIAQQSTVGASYHVPRGPAVVANLAAPRSNVATVRTPMVVTAQNQQHTFVRPARTPSPAQGTAWLTNTSNTAQIKGAPAVLSTPMRSATVTGKSPIVGRPQPQTVTSIRPGAILQNAITIGQSGQIQTFKTGATGMQPLGNTVTLAHLLPARSQSVVYSAGTTFTSARITVANTATTSRPTHSRSIGQVTTARLTVPATVPQQTRIIPQQPTVLPGTRIATIPSQSQPVLASSSRIVTTQPNVAIGRLSVATAPAATNPNLLGQARISTLNLHSLVAVANTTQARTLQAQGAKVITQPAQGTIHLTPLTTTVKTTASVVTTTQRTINVSTAILSQQRQATVVPPQAISISKVFPQTDGQGTPGSTTNVFIHAPVQSTTRRTSPSPIPSTCIATASNTATTTSVPTYSVASGTYYYDNSASTYTVSRSFPLQSTGYAFSQNSQQSRPPISAQGTVPSQPMRYNPVMVVEQSRGQQASQQFPVVHTTAEHQPQQQNAPKVTSSPRPSILRKRDHEGSPLKAAKNLIPVLQCMPVQSPQAPISPPLTRPDSRGNGHSSGGSTTISATSSPGIAEVNEDSNHAIMNHQKDDEETKPPLEMSPRKKPRKQQLTGNDLDEHNDDMQFISESAAVKKESNNADESDANRSDEPKDGAPEAGQVTTVRKPASASLLNSYRQNWKATHNHYLRHSDVKPKEERRPTIMDLANQCRVQEKVNGWKIHHLSTQMEDLADQEQDVYSQLTELLRITESEQFSRDTDMDVDKINELIKGNLQRIKIINDGMLEAKSQIMKIFDHKTHVTDIINRCASKRNFKKRDKS